MKESENIDKLFRKALANLSTEPPVAVKSALDKSLDSIAAKKPWFKTGLIVGVISLAIVSISYVVVHNQTSSLPVVAQKNIETEQTPSSNLSHDVSSKNSSVSAIKQPTEKTGTKQNSLPVSEKTYSSKSSPASNIVATMQNQVVSSKTKSSKPEEDNSNSLQAIDKGKSAGNQAKGIVNETKKVNATASFNYKTETLCHASRVTFSNTSTFDEGASYFWDLGDGSSSKISNPVHDYEQSGDFNVRLFAETKDGKSDYITTRIHIEVEPTVSALFSQQPDPQNASNAGILFNDKSANATSWLWDFGDGKFSAEQNPVHQYDQEGPFTVTLVAKNNNGCTSVYKNEINVYPLWIPNAFTPNNDGKNDVFFVSNGNYDFQSFSMTIYDRKGRTVFTSDSYTKPWDGKELNGVPAQQGAYIYLVQITSKKGKSYSFKGNMSLIR